MTAEQLTDIDQRRDAMLIHAAAILALVPRADKNEAAKRIGDLISRAIDLGAKNVEACYREAIG